MNATVKNCTKIFGGLLLIASIDFAAAETMEEGKKHKKLDFAPIIEQMQLSDEQSRQFTATLKKHRAERKEMKKQMREEIHNKNKAAMAEVLTPEQLEMFNVFMEENHPKRRP
jgi:L-fucose mutarotase/ribose pyranase (RbsD/FucU family)